MSESPTDASGYAFPYPHQVGGHGQLAITASGYILKPLLKREHEFYKYIHSQDLPAKLQWLRQVTPKFYGDTDYPVLTIRPTDVPPPARQVDNADVDARPTQTWRTSDGLTSPSSISPWSASMRLRIEKAAAGASDHTARRALALENITDGFVNPCVLDCKTGIRHYDDDATVAKRRRHIAKANATTTAACGVRFNGMQSFKRTTRDAPDGVFEAMDKYHGRTLLPDDLIPEATWFFHDSISVRVDCIRAILSRLSDLREYLIEQNHFFFYSCSLLLVYDGALPEVTPTRADIRMIDFAHTVPSNGQRDDGVLFGINYLIQTLTAVVNNERSHQRQLPARARPSSSIQPNSTNHSSPIATHSNNIVDEPLPP